MELYHISIDTFSSDELRNEGSLTEINATLIDKLDKTHSLTNFFFENSDSKIFFSTYYQITSDLVVPSVPTYNSFDLSNILKLHNCLMLMN